MFKDTYPLLRDNKKPPGWHGLLIAIIIAALLLLFVLVFGSCYTPQKAEQQLLKANNKYPAVVATMARQIYPCVTKQSDTAVVYKDSLVYIDCPAIDEGNGTQAEFAGKDTVVIIKNIPGKTLPGKTIRVPVTLPVKTVYVTNKVEDSAKIFLLVKNNEKLATANKKLQDKVDNRGHWNLRLLIALAISLLINFLQYKMRRNGKQSS